VFAEREQLERDLDLLSLSTAEMKKYVGLYFHCLFVFMVWCRSLGQMMKYVLSTMFVNIVYRSLTCVARTKQLSWGPGAKSSSFICTYVAAQIKMGTKLILSIRVCSNGSWGLGPCQNPMGNSRSTFLFY